MIFIHMYIGPTVSLKFDFRINEHIPSTVKIQNQKGYLTSYDLFQTPLDQYK